MNLDTFLIPRNKLPWMITGLLCIFLLGVIDYLTGYELSLSFFYLLPICAVTWYTADKYLGLSCSIVSSITWLVADYTSGHPYTHPSMYFWNTGIRLGFFIIVTLLLSALRTSLEHQQALARTDYLTGAVNPRHFQELAQREIDRSVRYQHSLSIAYMDLDNFKAINDYFGHNIGDLVLCTVVDEIKKEIREQDTVVRLGGDEFAILFPETDQDAARIAITRVQNHLLENMQKKTWPVTLSIGVITCVKPPKTVDDLIKLADTLMYTVKNHGKNDIVQTIYHGE
jgi:diguanylate cyclase (GGDEF)-like protein